MTFLQDGLNLKYKKLINLESINNINANTLFQKNVTISSLFSVVREYYSNNLIIGSNLSASYYTANNVTISTIFTDSISVPLLTVSSILNGNNVIFNNLYSNNINTNNDYTVLNNFNTSNLESKNLFVNNIQSEYISITSPLINIGTTTSVVNIHGNINYIITNNYNISDKTLILNYESNTIENEGGIIIETDTSNKGFLKTSIDLDYYQIKAPKGTTSKIFISDYNDNIYITGNNIIYKNCTILNNLNVPNIITSTLNIASSMTVLNDAVFNYKPNSALRVNNLYCSNNSNIITFNSLQSNKLISSTLNNIDYITGINILCVNNSLNITNDLISNITSFSYISNSSIFVNQLTTTNILTKSDSIINDNLTALSFGYALNGNINGNITINGILQVLSLSCNTILPITTGNFNNLACNNIINMNNTPFQNILSIYNNVALYNTSEYLTNTEASNNLPLGCFYRTGGILKVVV